MDGQTAWWNDDRFSRYWQSHWHAASWMRSWPNSDGQRQQNLDDSQLQHDYVDYSRTCNFPSDDATREPEINHMEEDREQHEEEGVVDEEFLQFLMITRLHQQERRKARELANASKKKSSGRISNNDKNKYSQAQSSRRGTANDTEYVDINQLDWERLNAQEASNKKCAPISYEDLHREDLQVQSPTLTLSESKRLRLQALEMESMHHFNQLCDRLKPSFWPTYPLNMSKYPMNNDK